MYTYEENASFVATHLIYLRISNIKKEAPVHMYAIRHISTEKLEVDYSYNIVSPKVSTLACRQDGPVRQMLENSTYWLDNEGILASMSLAERGRDRIEDIVPFMLLGLYFHLSYILKTLKASLFKDPLRKCLLHASSITPK